MPSKNITFDPDTGVPYGANLTIYGGADFETTFNVTNNSNTAFNLSGYSGSAAISKSVAVGATLGVTTSFSVGITSAAGGKIKISLGSTSTRNLDQGRYMYDVVVSSGSTLYTLVNGNVMVVPAVSSAP
jgi:hypothetical protein|tara:strand:+ start:2680 stop:3066 length:387 start_codon:yes stop_codon:yes gene_type:complete